MAVAVWRSGNSVRRYQRSYSTWDPRLLIRWMIVFGWENHVGYHPGQLSVLPICGCACGWQVKLLEPSLTGAIPELFVVSETQ